jgi:hypothetical protein
VSADARNSIYLWAGGLAFFGFFWASFHFDLFRGISNRWLWPLFGLAVVTNLAKFVWGLWKRRTSNPDDPNG